MNTKHCASIAAIGLFLTGCGDGADETIQFAVESASVEQGLAVTCSNDVDSLRVESVRVAIDQEIQFDDGLRNFARALRIMDSEGHTFSIVAEGDTPTEWIEHDRETEPRPIEQEHYDLARSCQAKVLEYEVEDELKADQEWLAKRLGIFADLEMESQYLDEETVQALELEDELKAFEEEEGTRKKALLEYYGSQYRYIQLIDSYYQKAFGWMKYDHTATVTSRYILLWGTWYRAGVQTTCNHGTCAEASGMQWYNMKYGPITNNPVGPQMCYGKWGIDHVCNNDTLLQQNNIVYNRYYDTQTSPQCNYNLLNRPY